MADQSTITAMTTAPSTPAPKPRRLWWVAGWFAGVVLLAAAGWWLAGQQVYTDGGALRLSPREAAPREIVWTAPRPLDEAFNTPDQEYEPAVSPDGTELYFVRGKAGGPTERHGDIYLSRRQPDGKWSNPEPVEAVNTDHDDLGPRLTADGKFLLLYSDRPGGVGGYDVWASARQPDGNWGTPFNLGPSVNSEFNEYSPAPTPDGRQLYFASNRKAAAREQKEAWRATIRQSDVGDYDLFVAELDASDADSLPASSPVFPVATFNRVVAATTQPAPATSPAQGPAAEPLGSVPFANQPTRPITAPSPQTSPESAPRLAYRPAREIDTPGVNSPYHEGASCLSPVGDFLYFASNRPGGLGKFDLYRCRLRDGKPVGPVENLGPRVNTPENEADPQLAVGGFHLLFSSDRVGTRGGYDLLASESREVYAERVARPLPHFGLSWWLLLVSLLVLIPLLMMVRGWDDRRLNLLQKCLLVSVLLHVVLTIIFSGYRVTREVISLARGESEMQVTIGLYGSPVGVEGAEGTVVGEIRGQMSDTPVSVPEPAAVAQQTDLPLETLEPSLASANVSLPQVQASSNAMVVAVPPAAPRVESAKLPRANVSPVAPAVMPPDVRVSSAVRIAQQADVQPNVPQPQMSAVRLPTMGDVASAGAATDAVQVPAAPAAPARESLASIGRVGAAPASGIATGTAAEAAVRPGVPGAAGIGAADVGARVPGAGGGRLAAAEAPGGGANAESAAPRVGRQEVASGTGGSGGGEAATQGIQSTVPTAGAGGSSLAQAIGTLAGTASASVPGGAAPPVAPQLGAVGGMAGPQPSVPRPGAAPAAVAESSLPTGNGDAPSVVTRQDVGASATQGAEVASSGPGVVQTTIPKSDAVGASTLVTPPGPAGGATVAAGASAGASPVAPAVPLAINQGSTNPGGIDAGVKAPPGARLALPTTGPSVAEPALAAARVAGTSGGAGASVATGPQSVNGGASPAAGATKASTIVALGPATRPSGVAAAAAGANGSPGVRVAVGPDAMAQPPVGTTPLKGGGSHLAQAEGAEPQVGEANVVTSQKQQRGAAMPSPVAPALADVSGKAGAPAAPLQGQSFASAAGPGPRSVGGGSTVQPAPQAAGLAAAPQVQLPGGLGPKVNATGPAQTPEASVGAGAPTLASARTQAAGEPVVRPDVDAGIAGLGAASPVGVPKSGTLVAPNVPAPGGARPNEVASARIVPQFAVSLPKLGAPEGLFQQRSAELRKPLLEKMGGTKESERAVDRGLAFLARQQEPNGRWTQFHDDAEPGRRGVGPHDPACTGLAVLAFLAADHTPVQDGPYKETVARGLEYLLSIQGEGGDLRGLRKGGGAGSGNMYDHGIATLALAEAALMTGDRRYTQAALRAAEFIVKAQHRGTGGWRYSPGEAGDTSVFGWQIMALHSAEQLGFEVPERTIDGIVKYVRVTSTGRQKMLGGYQPGTGATQPMTAELTFSRILLGERFDDEQAKTVSTFLTREMADRNNYNLYYWYYASLCLMQLQNDDWRAWNEQCRDTLVRIQRKNGTLAGSWDPNDRWGGEGGRVYSTAMATLTLEVYYRYLPLIEKEQGMDKPREQLATPSYLRPRAEAQ